MLYNKMEQSVVKQFMLRKQVGLVKAEATTTKHQRRVRFSCRSVTCDELRRNRAGLAHSLLRRFVGCNGMRLRSPSAGW